MTQQLMHRFWCGALPRFSLPSGDDERRADDDTSVTFFGSREFATLRTRLRLALQETPAITQSRQLSTPQLMGVIELAEQYQQYVAALLKYSRYAPPSHGDSPLGKTYAPLFHGFGDSDLSADRLVGKERRLGFALPVDVVLTAVLLGQFHALHAEALVTQGLKLQSEPIVAAADASWCSSTLQFTRAASLANAALGQCIKGDPQVASVVKFYSCVAAQAIVMARLAQMHRTSACITSLLLVDETIERLARNAAVCARYAYTVAVQTHEVAEVLDDSPLSRQLAWLVRSYVIRWRSIFYSYEQTVFHLDFQPEIAMHFGDLLQRCERLQPLPPYSHRHDSYFARLAHELQTSHAAQLNESLDLKTTLIGLCQRKFGSMWSFEPLPRELLEEFGSIVPLESLFCQDSTETDGDLERMTLGGTSGPLTSDAIGVNVQRAREVAGMETSSVVACSTEAVDNEETHREGQRINPTKVATPTSSQPRSRAERPSSAGLLSSSASQSTIARANSRSSSDWVSMRVAGGKTLVFEPLLPPPSAKARPSTAGSIGTKGHRRNAVPMVVDDVLETDTDPAFANPRQRLKSLRPASSPSYLTSSTTPKKKVPDSGGLTWVPTRVACALCERRFMRQNLPGVVVMKRVFDLRRKWGMVLQDSKKFNAASALYGRASVCLTCQDILTFEDDKDSLNNPSSEQPLDDMGVLIRNRILADWQQRPAASDELLLDVAVSKRARQSSTNFGLHAPNAVQSESLRTAHTREEKQPWWEVDLANYYVVHSIKIWLREDTSHVYSFGGSGNKQTSTGADRKITTTPELALSSMGFLHSGAGGGTACGSLAPAPQPNLGLYPLHIVVSMKTGVDRDLDDILASSVSKHTIPEKAVQPITWLTPPNCRGRFVRIQAEGVAFLHIERVNVFVSQDLPTQTATMKRESARSQLKRAAFRASVIGKKPSAQSDSSTSFTSNDATLAALAFQSRTTPPLNYGQKSDPKGSLSTFTDPEQAEKRRISRLYQKFKGLLDARTKYAPTEDLEEEARVRFEN